MARVTLAGRMVAGLATTSLTLGLATVVAPSSAAQQAGSDPLSGVYLLDVDLYACTFDDPDDATEFKPPRTCVDPPGAPQTSPDYTNQTRPARTGRRGPRRAQPRLGLAVPVVAGAVPGRERGRGVARGRPGADVLQGPAGDLGVLRRHRHVRGDQPDRPVPRLCRLRLCPGRPAGRGGRHGVRAAERAAGLRRAGAPGAG